MADDRTVPAGEPLLCNCPDCARHLAMARLGWSKVERLKVQVSQARDCLTQGDVTQALALLESTLQL